MFIINNMGITEPFGPMILSAVLKDKGNATTLGVLREEDVEKKIYSWKPDVLAYSMMSVDMPNMKKFNDELRKKIKIFTILGGVHATIDRSCIDDPGIDAICVGEGEDAILDVVEHLKQGKDLSGIPNIMVSRNDTLKQRNLIEDFDKYPFMDRDLVYSYPEMGNFGVKGIWTSRGCLFPCPYCFNNRINNLFKNNGKIVRRRSVDSVIKETLELKNKYKVSFIRIQDDVFVHNADSWLKEFAKRWSSEVKLPFYCLVRSELVTEELAFYLKKAGCFSISMSTEAADDGVRNRMLRRKISKEQLENAFSIFKKYKINVYANNMLALPFTTLEHDIASVDFAIKVQPEMPNFSIFMPYPGTDLGDYCKNAGIYDPVKDYIDYGIRSMSSLTCFSQKTKEAQYNLAQLAIVAVKFPKLRNFIVNKLIHLKPNIVFFLIHYYFAISSYGRKMFYFKHTPREYLELIAKTIKYFLFTDFSKKKKNKTKSDNLAKINGIPLTEERRKEELEKCIKALEAGKFTCK